MSQEILVNELNEIDSNLFVYTIPERIIGSGFKSYISINEEPVCFSLIFNKKNNINNNTIEFELENDSLELVKKIEENFINASYLNRLQWFSNDFPLNVLNNFYTPMVSNNILKSNINSEDIDTIYDSKDNVVSYENIKEDTRIEVVFVLESLVFLKQSFFCDIQVKQINEAPYYLVNYNSDEEMVEDIDLENSEVIDLTENIIDLNSEKDKEITEKTKIMEEVRDELNLLKLSIIEKEEILNNTEEELSKLNNSTSLQ